MKRLELDINDVIDLEVLGRKRGFGCYNGYSQLIR
jgi:hypothetical protein